MLDLMKQNAELIQIGLNALMVLIWFLYLHLILMNFMRQRQSVILITRGTSSGPSGRCFVTNMGSEPIYLLAAFVSMDSESGSYRAPVTERDEMYHDDLKDPSKATNQGPLNCGEVRDIGDFTTMERRARSQARDAQPPDTPTSFTVVIVAVSGHVARLVGAYQSFAVVTTPDGPNYVPNRVVARQIKNLRRSRWSHLLEEMR